MSSTYFLAAGLRPSMNFSMTSEGTTYMGGVREFMNNPFHLPNKVGDSPRLGERFEFLAKFSGGNESVIELHHALREKLKGNGSGFGLIFTKLSFQRR